MDNDLKMLCNNILRLCSELIDNHGGLKPNEVLAISFAIKIRNSVSSAMKLLDDEFVHDGYVLLRTIAEATIYCCESLKNEDFRKNYHKGELKRSKLLTDKIVKYESIKNGAPSPKMVKQAKFLKNAFAQHEGTLPDLQELAKSNDCLVEYFDFHALGNAYVHSLPNVLSSYIELNEQTKHITFIQMPDKDESIQVLFGCVYCLMKVAGNMNRHFRLGRQAELLEIQRKFDKALDDRMNSIRTTVGIDTTSKK